MVNHCLACSTYNCPQCSYWLGEMPYAIQKDDTVISLMPEVLQHFFYNCGLFITLFLFREVMKGMSRNAETNILINVLKMTQLNNHKK